MASITVYTFEDGDGTEQSYSTQDLREAQDFARQYHYRIIANEFEWSDSEVIEDNTDNPLPGFGDDDEDEEDEESEERVTIEA